MLLKGVNDDAAVLAELMRAFVELRVKPYYLHHPGPGAGDEPFPRLDRRGQALVAPCAGRVSGLAQPTYILDIPGGYGKAVITPGSIRATGRRLLFSTRLSRRGSTPTRRWIGALLFGADPGELGVVDAERDEDREAEAHDARHLRERQEIERRNVLGSEESEDETEDRNDFGKADEHSCSMNLSSKR